MSLTFMDIFVILLTVFSGFLAMLRGFSREVLSLSSWLGAAIITYFFHEKCFFLFENYFQKPLFVLVCSIALVFFVSLIILYFIMMKISNLLIQSRIGPIDRLFGLAFGCARGLFLCSFFVILIMTMTRPENRPYWFENARTLPFLQHISENLLKWLPSDLSSYIDYAETLRHKSDDTNESDI